MTIRESLELRYPNQNPHCTALREWITELCQNYIKNGLGDKNAEQRLCSNDDAQYWQQLSEVLLADQFDKARIQVAHPHEGPDFLIEHDGRKIWVEVTCPEPNGLPEEWRNHIPGRVSNLPHEEILLRWTNAISEKSKVLIRYLEKGIVRKEDAYIIAINGRLLRGFGGLFPELNGISQFPFAVEAVFCVGPIQIHIDRQTLRTVGSDHQHRPLIPKPNGAVVPADTFLDPKFAPISAIWAVDVNVNVDENLLAGQSGPLVVVHNPANPIPTNLLPAHAEYIATDHGDHFKLERRDGRLNLQSTD
ncbi:MAG: hypothetical protein ACT4O2_15140 [Beijerinckiaceae bacterium]